MSVSDEEKVLEMDGGEGCKKKVTVLNATELYTLKYLKWQIYVMCIFTTMKKALISRCSIFHPANLYRPFTVGQVLLQGQGSEQWDKQTKPTFSGTRGWGWRQTTYNQISVQYGRWERVQWRKTLPG